MARLNMNGPYIFNSNTVNSILNIKSSGNYAFGVLNSSKTFYVKYVGRSDNDIQTRLLSWVGKTKSTHFKFSYASSPKEAFEKECINYHDFNPSENTNHPGRPNGTFWKCPKCNIFDN